MRTGFSLGVIGADDATSAIAERLGRGRPFSGGPLELTRWAANDADPALASIPALAAEFHVEHETAWRRITEDASIDAVYVGGQPQGRLDPVISALSSGKVVLCPVPVALTMAELDRVDAARDHQGGVLLAPSHLEATPAGREGLQQILQPDSGAIQSVYYAARRPVATTDLDALDEFGWEALHFLEACVGSPLVRSFMETRELFGRGGRPDTVVAILRHQNGVVSTLELSRCLPTAYGRNTVEVEIEVITDQGVVRIEPNQHLVHVVPSSPEAARRIDWHPHPVIHLLDRLVQVLDGGDQPRGDQGALRSVVEAMAQLRGSAS